MNSRTYTLCRCVVSHDSNVAFLNEALQSLDQGAMSSVTDFCVSLLNDKILLSHNSSMLLNVSVCLSFEDDYGDLIQTVMFFLLTGFCQNFIIRSCCELG